MFNSCWIPESIRQNNSNKVKLNNPLFAAKAQDWCVQNYKTSLNVIRERKNVQQILIFVDCVDVESKKAFWFVASILFRFLLSLNSSFQHKHVLNHFNTMFK